MSPGHPLPSQIDAGELAELIADAGQLPAGLAAGARRSDPVIPPPRPRVEIGRMITNRAQRLAEHVLR